MNEVSGKNKIGRIILIISIICLVGIGLSFGYYLISRGQESNNIAGSKCFKLELTNQSKEITLDTMYPISDEEGMSLTPYTFTLTNTCDIEASYSINLEMLEGTTLDSKYLDAVLNNSGIKLLTSYNTTGTVITGSTESRTLTTGSLRAKESKDYTLRFWMDKDVEDTNSMNKVFKSKIVVSAEATELPPLLTDKITELASTDTVNFASDDPDNNIRYIGANPDNYVYFNCSDYSNQTADACEKWRIIGLFNNMIKSDGTKEKLVKIIRDDSIGSYSWDSSDSSVNNGSGVNNWTDSDVMKLLNPGYESESAGGSLYYNAESGTCYYDSSNATTSCDFTSTGLKNDTTRNTIESVVWNLGGANSYSSSSNGLASHWYGYERGTTVYSGHTTTWTGKVGLMYPSDYGYAASGGTTKDRTACLAKELYNWDTSDFSDCKRNDYLYNSSLYQWTLAPYSANAYGVFRVGTDGGVYFNDARYVRAVRPVLFLKSNIYLSAGNGSSEEPYQLKIS